jgi:hypothetical protein
MKTPAIITSLTVVGSIAYAAGSQGVSSKQPPMMPSRSQAHSMQEEMRQTRMQMAGECIQGAGKNWFTKVHTVSDGCSAIADVTCRQDINGDGIAEYLMIGGGLFLRDGQGSTVCLAITNEAVESSDGPAFINSCVLNSSVLEDFVTSNFPKATWGDAWFVGFRDMDDDQDLDLVVNLNLRNAEGPPSDEMPTWSASQEVWIENTEFPHTNNVAADLNRDGIVDGNDLGNLLAAWGPVQ